MAKSIERRIATTVLGAVVLTLAVAVASVLVANEGLEQAILELDMQAERDFLLGQLDPNQPQAWETASLQGFYVPQALVDSVGDTVLLPEIFRDKPFPYAEEVEIGDETFMVSAVQTANGRLYLAKDITLFEQQEGWFERFLVLLCVVMLAVATVLARMTGRRLAAPLGDLTRQMAHTEPAPIMARVSVNSVDWELQAIAQSFNRFLAEIEHYVQREKSLLGMASHELRTPIAIAAGALDGIEQRGQVAASDLKAVARIRQAVTEMGSNVDAILKLTRREAQPLLPVELTQVLAQVVQDARADAAGNQTRHNRIRFYQEAKPVVRTDPTLVKMLIRNLLHNALQHTQGAVDVRLSAHWLDVQDEGAGLPPDYRDYLSGKISANAFNDANHNTTHGNASRHTQPPGLGLFIVTLICERLGWRLQVCESPQAGTHLRLNFGTSNLALIP